MKNFLPLTLLACLNITTSLSQSPGPIVRKNPIPVVKQINGPHGVQKNGTPSATLFEVIIGNSTYDLQTNAAGCNRIYQQAGNVAATWSYSNSFSLTFPDRGIGYNYYDGVNWGAFPLTPLDSIAWPNIDLGAGNTEYILGHYKPTMPNDLALLKRTPAGSGSWVKTNLPPDPMGNFYLWPRMRVGGPNGNSIHVIAISQPSPNGGISVNGVDGVLSYSRSQDGGVTWDQLHVTLPGIDSTNYFSVSPDCYALDVRGSTIAIVQGSKFNPWVLWKSVDNGTTWVRTVITPFPIPAYDPATMITDVNGDAIADTIDFIDGSLAVLIDNNDMVHTWAGRMRVLQDTPGSMMIFKDTDGLLYWNQGLIAGIPIMIASCEDIDLSGAIEVPEAISGYDMSMTTFPTAAIDASNNIILAYSGIVENTTNGMPPPDEEAYRNIYCMISPDNGSSWSLPVRIAPSDFDECAYPSLARNVGPDLYLMYQKDPEPGVAVGGTDPIYVNEIVFTQEDPTVLFSGITIINYDYYRLEGNVYFDQNQNGIKDGGDFNMNNFSMYLAPNNQIGTTNSLGNYTFLADSGTKTVSLVNNGNWAITTDSTSYTVTTTTGITSGLDFGIYPVNLVYDVSTNITGGIPRCNNYITYWVAYYNEGTVATSGTVKFVKDSQLTYTAASPPYSQAAVDTFEWNFTNLLPGEARQVMITFSSFGVPMGDTLINCASTYYDNGSTGGMSEDCLTQYVVCSYDPNDKAVIPEGVGAQHYALLTDTLFYTIRFQNTGNDTAFTVKIRDTLDALLDPATFRLIGSSHPVDVSMLPGNILLFSFENILLPDSNVNNPGSNGYVKYSIRPDAGIPIGSVINNTAHIFFDYNPAIVTNTITNTLVDVIGLASIDHSETDMVLYPNPFTNQATLRFGKPLIGTHQLSITDLSGRVVMQKFFTGQETKIQKQALNKGIYLCYVKNNSGELVGVVKMVIK